jgi:hypothetical protein
MCLTSQKLQGFFWGVFAVSAFIYYEKRSLVMSVNGLFYVVSSTEKDTKAGKRCSVRLLDLGSGTVLSSFVAVDDLLALSEGHILQLSGAMSVNRGFANLNNPKIVQDVYDVSQVKLK